ncbi:hypothetical protein ONV78_29605 [Hahella sp. CR1]|uniref:hypothetical protein n=1 Tax=Hahella sp. CR1 TaxID=2992807 RepID=UPI002442E545|nr:hypothetical protein [Hahella sp. CR1]MDG9671926.1 hypothetical protein [Hahella sp. CR1]
MTESIFERFTSPATMIEAELELLEQGEAAVAVIESLLNGDAKNKWGVPYRAIGLPLRCALEVAIRLGPTAKPLEPYILSELKMGDPTAARALGALDSLEETSVVELAKRLSDDAFELSFESAAALWRCGHYQHPMVLRAATESEKAAKILAWFDAYLLRRTHTKT